MKLALRISLVLGLTGLLLWIWLRGLDLGAVREALGEARPLLLALACLAGLIHVPVRAWRWRALLDTGGEPPPFRELLLTTSVGYLVTFVVPGRIGEVVRPALLATRNEVPLGEALASVVFERLLDIATLLLLLGLFVLASPELASDELRRWTAILLPAAALGAAAGVFVHRRWRSTLDLILSGAARRLPGRLGTGTERLALTALRGFDSLLRPGAWWRLPALSLATWSFPVLCFGLTMAATGTLVSWTAPLLLTAWGAVGMAIPTPAGIGGFTGVVTWVMEAFLGVEPARAAAGALLVHATSVLPVFGLGLYYFLREGLSVASLKDAAAAKEPEAESAS